MMLHQNTFFEMKGGDGSGLNFWRKVFGSISRVFPGEIEHKYVQ